MSVVSLNINIKDEEDTELGSFIPDDGPGPDDLCYNDELREIFNKVLSHLTPREAEVIISRFGLNDVVPLTLEEIGDKLGITRERVRQIETKALRKLKSPFRTKMFDGYK